MKEDTEPINLSNEATLKAFKSEAKQPRKFPRNTDRIKVCLRIRPRLQDELCLEQADYEIQEKTRQHEKGDDSTVIFFNTNGVAGS